MTELLVGVLVAVAALALVLEPLVRPAAAHAAGKLSPADDIEFADPRESTSPKVQALLALKEIEFDRATGKLSDDDYESLKAKYSSTALRAIRDEDDREAVPTGDFDEVAEAAIRRARGKAKFCSECGSKLPPVANFCGECGAEVL